MTKETTQNQLIMGKEENFGDKRNTNGFDKRPEDINKGGRPKKRKIYKYLKAKGFSKDEIREAFLELSFHDTGELKMIFEDEEQPALLRIVARQLNKALQKGDWSAVSYIIDQVIGKPPQEISGEMEHNVDSVVDLLSEKEERDANRGKGKSDKKD